MKLVVDFSPHEIAKTRISKYMETAKPKGDTPLRCSLLEAIKDFGQRQGRIILITDGIGRCGEQKCSNQVKLRTNIAVDIHIIGYKVNEEESEKLRAMAKDLRASYYAVAQSEELGKQLIEIRALPPVVTQQSLEDAGRSGGGSGSSTVVAEKSIVQAKEVPSSAVIAISIVLILIVYFLLVSVFVTTDKVMWRVIITLICVLGIVGIVSNSFSIGEISLVVLGLCLAAIVLMALVATSSRNSAIAVAMLLTFGALLIVFGFSDLGSWGLPTFGLFPALALVACIWLLGIQAMSPLLWLRLAQARGVLLLGILALFSVLTSNTFQQEAGSRPSGWLMVLSFAMVLFISLVPFKLWTSWPRLSPSQLVLSGAVWLLAGGCYLLFEVCRSSNWHWTAVAVGVMLLAFLELLDFRASAFPLLINWIPDPSILAKRVACLILFLGYWDIFSQRSLPWWLSTILVLFLVVVSFREIYPLLLTGAIHIGLLFLLFGGFSFVIGYSFDTLEFAICFVLFLFLALGIVFGFLGYQNTSNGQWQGSNKNSARRRPRGIRYRLRGARRFRAKPGRSRPRYLLRIPYHEGMLSCGGHEGLKEQFRLLLAVKLHERGRLTSNLAAEIAGIPEEQFLEAFQHLRCPPAKEVPVIKEVVREVPVIQEVVREVIREVPVIRESIREVPERRISPLDQEKPGGGPCGGKIED